MLEMWLLSRPCSAMRYVRVLGRRSDDDEVTKDQRWSSGETRD